MEYTEKNNTVILTGIKDLDLQETLDCGQCFRWDIDDNGFFGGVVRGKAVKIKKESDSLTIEGATKDDCLNLWNDYFDLNLDYGKIREDLSQLNPVLKEAALYAPGIRILKQEPWEALCSFIISQNNNIPRIKGIIGRLCSEFGKCISDGIYSFPSAQVMAELSVEDLAPLRSGFRAKYLIDAAQKVAGGEINLEQIETMPVEQAKKLLMTIKGVGPKVADCTLLYGMHRLECFPLDVWMKRAMETLFPKMSPSDFGEYAGIAQQYIFHYSRKNPQLFEK